MSNKKYGRAWKRIRDKYIADHTMCEMCIAKSLYIPYHAIQPAIEVHHIIPMCEGGTHSISNLMALCHKCHAEIHETYKEEQYEDNNQHKDKGNQREETQVRQ